ncbi:MAG: YicC family protein [Phycisphaera sp.]|nr:YicC family protein [Phycisphaera sp.]
MIHSMTGFGDASDQARGVHFHVEVRSLNNRYFKATIRTPEELSSFEAEAESLLRKRLTRGSITCTLRTRVQDATAAHRVNDAALVAYLEHLKTLQSRIETDAKSLNIDLTALLTLPGVLETDDDDFLATARPIIKQLLDKACERLIQMRIEEGRAIEEDLARQRETIRTKLASIAKRAPAVVEEYHQRLRTRVDELLARASLKLGEADLAREVALFAERSDISEEINRLTTHLEQFAKVTASEGDDAAGRTLDFIAQEMLREANTIASKSNDAVISRDIVEIKTAIDRIKEQVQNVE